MRNEIINTNCLDYLIRQPDNSIDFILTSPPYDTMRRYKGQVTWNYDIFKQISQQLVRCIKPGAVIVWVVGDMTINHNETGTSFRQALYFKDLGLNLYDTMIFEKANPMPGYKKCMYRQSFEYIFVLCKGEMEIFNPILVPTVSSNTMIYRKENKWKEETGKTTSGELKKQTPAMRYHNNIFNYAVGRINVAHPATFPIKLAKDMIYTYTREGQTVFDPFAGSGTTNIAAFELDRGAIGIEIVDEYAAIARKRLNTAMSQKRIPF